LIDGTDLKAGQLDGFQTPSEKVPDVRDEWDFAGYIVYRDADNAKRFTGFWRRFNKRTGFAVPIIENSEYNYED
jgi:hypothetical protein